MVSNTAKTGAALNPNPAAESEVATTIEETSFGSRLRNEFDLGALAPTSERHELKVNTGPGLQAPILATRFTQQLSAFEKVLKSQGYSEQAEQLQTARSSLKNLRSMTFSNDNELRTEVEGRVNSVLNLARSIERYVQDRSPHGFISPVNLPAEKIVSDAIQFIKRGNN